MDVQSKSKNIEIYKHLLNFGTIEIAKKHLSKLSEQLKCHKNKIIACIGQAQRNSKIYIELTNLGYLNDQIPKWFRRPEENNLVHDQPQNKLSKDKIVNTRRLPIVTSRPSIKPTSNNIKETKIFDWDEVQKYSPLIRPKSRFNYVFERQFEELEEIHWSHYQERIDLTRTENAKIKKEKINQELAQACDPFTALEICKKDTKFRRWFENQSPQEKTKTIKAFVDYFQLKINIEMQQRQAQFFYCWWTGRLLGIW